MLCVPAARCVCACSVRECSHHSLRACAPFLSLALLSLATDIATAGKDSDFEPVREEVRRMLLELNLNRVRLCVDEAAGVGLAGRL